MSPVPLCIYPFLPSAPFEQLDIHEYTLSLYRKRCHNFRRLMSTSRMPDDPILQIPATLLVKSLSIRGTRATRDLTCKARQGRNYGLVYSRHHIFYHGISPGQPWKAVQKPLGQLEVRNHTAALRHLMKKVRNGWELRSTTRLGLMTVFFFTHLTFGI